APLPAPDTGRSASRSAPFKRLASIIVVAIAVFGTWSILIGSDVVQRVMADDGSAAQRKVAYGIFFEHMNEFFILGGGSETSGALPLQLGRGVGCQITDYA